MSNELKEQLDNQQLLMDYPYTNDIHSVEDRDCCVSANTVRILLLEQQNSQLREAIHSQLPNKPHPTPVKVWYFYHLYESAALTSTLH